jgi:hypothetical protein
LENDMKITEKVAPRPITVGVTLELSLADALVLQQILYRVGGYPEGPRGIIDTIGAGLDGVLGDPEDREDNYDLGGHITINTKGST